MVRSGGEETSPTYLLCSSRHSRLLYPYLPKRPPCISTLTAVPLKPVRHKVGKRVYWRVRLGYRITGKAQPEQHYFATRKEANAFIQSSLKAKQESGQAAFTMGVLQQADATSALKLLDPYEVSLLEAAQHFLKTSARTRSIPTFQAHADAYIAARKKTCAKRTLSNYRSELKHSLAEFGSLPVSEIYQSDIEEWSADLDLAPRTVSNVLDTMTSVLADAVKKRLLEFNPAEHVPRPPEVAAAPGVLTPAQARLLLQKAAELKPFLVPCLAMGLFAGLRRSELCALSHTRILMDEQLIEITSATAKTRQRRLVEIQPNLNAWLQTFPPATSSHVTRTHNPDVFGQWLSDLAVAAGILPWPHNALRHSYGSYFLALTKNENRVAMEMGNSPAVVYKHYRAVVRPAAAEDFFAIVP